MIGHRILLEALGVHHGCPRNEYYEYKASAEKPSDLGCMMEHMGCLGTQARADCNTRLWNGSGSCLRGGYACINCTAPDFHEPGHAFDRTPKIAGIPNRVGSRYRLRDRTDATDTRHVHQCIHRVFALQYLLKTTVQRRHHPCLTDAVASDIDLDFEVAFNAVKWPGDTA